MHRRDQSSHACFLRAPRMRSSPLESEIKPGVVCSCFCSPMTSGVTLSLTKPRVSFSYGNQRKSLTALWLCSKISMAIFGIFYNPSSESYVTEHDAHQLFQWTAPDGLYIQTFGAPTLKPSIFEPQGRSRFVLRFSFNHLTVTKQVRVIFCTVY